MAMTEAWKNLALDGAVTTITHIGLVDDKDTELSGGSYARVAVTWASASGGVVRPNADLTFEVPAGSTVGGWRCFTASSGGTNYGGSDVTNEAYAGDGQYKLLAAGTGISLADPA